MLNYPIISRQFYDKLAFLRDLDCIESLNTYLKLLNRVQIEAPINSSLLNNWTPSPLVLAGLVQGKEVKGWCLISYLGINQLIER